MGNDSRKFPRSSRALKPKSTFDSPPPLKAASPEQIIHLIERSVSSVVSQVPDRCRSKLSEQLAVIKKDLNQPSVQQAAQHSLLVITTPEQVDQLKTEIQQMNQAVFTLATTGDDPSTDRLLGIAITLGTKDYYIPLWHQFPGGQLLPDQLAPTLLANRFSLAGVKFITHEAKTVVHFLRHHVGINVPFSHDTKIAAELLVTNGQTDLTSLMNRLLGKAVSEVPELSLESTQHQSIEATAKIMADRCHTILEIFEIQRSCKDSFLMKNVEMPLVAPVAELEDNGYQVDCDYMQKLSERCQSEQAVLLEKIRCTAGPEFNPDAADQVAAFVYDKLDNPIQERTPHGKPSVKEAALLPFVKNHPIVGDILEYQTVGRAEAIIASVLAKVDKDGRYRVTYIQLGTKSGRITSKSHIQTLPKDDRYSIRRGFIAKPGYKLVAADFDQQDLRVLGALSGDAKLQAAFDGDVDLHGVVAKPLFNLPCDPGKVKEQYPAERQKAKAFQFALIYGATPYGLAQTLDVDADRAANLMTRYFEQFPGIKAFIDDAHGRLQRDGYLDDVFGRRRWFPEVLTTRDRSVLDAAKRSGHNHLVQAPSATITKLAMIRCFQHISKEHPEIKMVLTLHDELHFEVPDALVDHFAQELPDLMCNLGMEKFGFQVPMKVNVSVGPNWADLKPYAGGVA